MDYVLGFQFDAEGSRVALIRKNRPDWQAGLYNGIGGHVETNELPGDAVLREFAEETGRSQDDVGWRHYARLETWAGNRVFCYASFTNDVTNVQTTTDEGGIVFKVATLTTERHLLVPSAFWMISMALSIRDELSKTASRLLIVKETLPLELS
jgi:8-oxo-dGTP diphosphatase